MNRFLFRKRGRYSQLFFIFKLLICSFTFRYFAHNYSLDQVFRQLYDRELRGVVFCNDLQLKYFNFVNAPQRVLQMTKDRASLMPVVIYFHNASVIRAVFNREIYKLIDYGLIDYWTREYVDERTKTRRYQQHVPKKLGLRNMSAIFEICFGLLVISCLVFVLEKLSRRFAWLKVFIERIAY